MTSPGDVRRGRWEIARRALAIVDADQPAGAATLDVEAIPPEYSDDALALSFAVEHADQLRYTAAWGRWHRWTGTRWHEDTTLHVFEFARSICREKAAACGQPKVATVLSSARTVAAVEKLARSDRRLAATGDQWDADPWLLSTPGGVVDLRTAELRAAVPSDYLTRQTSVTPGGDCPRWREFLRWATDGDEELELFLQRAFGYALTGDIREHALFFFYGAGGNGKSTILNALTGIAGDYATVAPMEAFTEARGERHPTDLAMLRGARLVTSQETDKGRRWAESRVKAITGGDPISARFMRQDFFTFRPQFKLLIAGNERPSLQTVDEAIRRRFHLVPFEQRVTADMRDEALPQKLRAEWSGILEWMLEGCISWIEQGLQPPDRVVAATAAYLTSEDSVGAWMEECCTLAATAWAASGDLYSSWATWAARAGEKTGTQKALAAELQKRGFTPAKSGHAKTRGYAGLSVKQDSANAYHERN